MSWKDAGPHSWRRLVNLMAGVALFITGCSVGAGGTSETATGGDLTLGAIIPQSGAFGSGGPATIAGLQIAADTINNAGGVKVGGKAMKIKWVILDDRTDPQVSVADAIQLVRDNHINVLIGPISNAAIAVAPIAADRHVIQISGSTALQALLGQPKYPLLFSSAPSINWRAGCAVAAIVHWFQGVKKVAFMAPDDATDQALFPIVTTLLTTQSMTSQNFDYPPDATDLSTVATKVAAYKPDLIFTSGATGSTQGLVNVLKSIDAAGISKQIPVFAYASSLDLIPTAAGRPFVSQVLYAHDFVAESPPDQVAFKNQLAAKLNIQPSAVTNTNVQAAIQFTDVIPLLAKAMEDANTTTKVTAIAASMTKVKAIGLGSVEFQWGPDHNVNYPIVSDFVDSSGTVHVAHLTP